MPIAKLPTPHPPGEWHKRYAVRSGIEGTVCEFAHGHGIRHCRYRDNPKARLQHVLTAIAVNIEPLSQRRVQCESAARQAGLRSKYFRSSGCGMRSEWRVSAGPLGLLA
jgi:hypothetical protein